MRSEATNGRGALDRTASQAFRTSRFALVLKSLWRRHVIAKRFYVVGVQGLEPWVSRPPAWRFTN